MNLLNLIRRGGDRSQRGSHTEAHTESSSIMVGRSKIKGSIINRAFSSVKTCFWGSSYNQAAFDKLPSWEQEKLIAQAMMLLEVENTVESVYTIVASMLSTLNYVPFTIMGMVSSPLFVASSAATFIGAVILLAALVIPIDSNSFIQVPTLSPTSAFDVASELKDRRCPDIGSVMFVGYKAENENSNTSQLLILAIDDLPGDLDFIITNDFELPTKDQIGSLKMTTRCAGAAAGTLFGIGIQNIEPNGVLTELTPGFRLLEEGSEVLLYCSDATDSYPIAALSYGNANNVPVALRDYSIDFMDSHCAIYDGIQIGSTLELSDHLTNSELWEMTCADDGTDLKPFEFPFQVLLLSTESGTVPGTSTRCSDSPSISHIPSSPPSTKRTATVTSRPSSLRRSTSAVPSREPSNVPNRNREPTTHPTVSDIPSVNPSDLPSSSMDPATSPTTMPSLDPASEPSGSPSFSMSPHVSPSSSPTISSDPSLSMDPASEPSGSPSVSRQPHPSPSLSPTIPKPQSESPSAGPSSSVSVLPSVSMSMGPSTDSSSPSMSVPPSLSTDPAPEPSEFPFLSPSAPPSSSLTMSPSASPSTSTSPSGKPSDASSVSPSTSPSSSPTIFLSASPSTTIFPSDRPSDTPSVSELPSLKHSVVPTLSDGPSIKPTLSPTISHGPSLKPTTFPTGSTAPNSNPSVFPSQSMDPTITPSLQPSMSMVPTIYPSSSPSLSVSPSLKPSGMPSLSVIPSVKPSLSPTVSYAPSLKPTAIPTFSTAPNAEPSVSPSQSMDPTIAPSLQPSMSMVPTTDPSSSPSLSVSPSLEPTGMPSLSMGPDIKPSLSPTISKSPSMKPSSLPSMSSFPSITPSSHPSIVPSQSPSISFSPTQLWMFMANITGSSVVAISSDTIILGDPYDDDAGSNAGCVYVFAQNGDDWSQQAKLTASASESNGNFGRSLAISGDSMIVGSDAGDAYIFAFDAGQWTEQARLNASDTSPTSNFGFSVAISGDIAIVGADVGKSAYIFAYDGTLWVQEIKLQASDNAFAARFGCSVGVSGNKVVVGDWANFDTIFRQGAAYVFAHNGTGWTEEAKLVAADPEDSANLGWSVAISGESIITGSRQNDPNGIVNAGSAYIFKWIGTEWSQDAKLIASDYTTEDKFGESVAISGDTAVISAPQKDIGGSDDGAAYIFFDDGTAWIEVAKLVAISDSELFGSTVSVSPSGDMVVVGEPSSVNIFSRSV